MHDSHEVNCDEKLVNIFDKGSRDSSTCPPSSDCTMLKKNESNLLICMRCWDKYMTSNGAYDDE